MLYEYCSALTRKEILTHAAACTNFEDIMLSETSQSLKDKCRMVRPTSMSYLKYPNSETESRMVAARKQGEGNGRGVVSCLQFQSGKTKKF